jgi:hypothetical protein
MAELYQHIGRQIGDNTSAGRQNYEVGVNSVVAAMFPPHEPSPDRLKSLWLIRHELGILLQIRKVDIWRR